MGEPVLILAFVVVVIGGIGSIGGALIAADPRRHDRKPWPRLSSGGAGAGDAASLGEYLGCEPRVDVDLYLLMAAILVWRPAGLLGARMNRAAIVNAALLAILIGGALVAQASGHGFWVTLATKAAIFALAGVGLNLALGYGGMVELVTPLFRDRRLCDGHPRQPRHVGPAGAGRPARHE